MPSPAGRALLTAVAGVAIASAPQPAFCQSPAVFLEKLAQSSKATYQARQLVVYLGHPQSAAVLEVRSSPQGTFVRAETPSDVTRVWRDPKHQLVSDKRLALEDLPPPTVPIRLADVLAKYEVRVSAPSALLGVSIVPLELLRRSDRRLVERLWVHPESGVVYRRELFGDDGELIGMSTMLEMRWGQTEEAEPYHGGRPAKVGKVKESGAPKMLPYGYRLQSAYTMKAGNRPAAHWVYSDGIHALSVFRVEGQLRRPRKYRSVDLGKTKGWVGPGPGTWMWEGGPATWAVVAEEPQLDPAMLTKAFPKGGPSIPSRLGSWWARAYHWVADRF